MQITVRHAEHADIEQLVSLLKELFAIEADFIFDACKQEKGLAMMLDNKQAFVFVAEYQSNVIALCTVQIVISTAEGGYVGLIEDLIVHASFRGLGVGRQLLARIDAWAKEHGLLRMQLLADKNNHAALAFYQRLHWHTTQLIALKKVF